MTLTSKSLRVPGWLLLIGAMTAVGPVSIDMYLPGFPLIEADFGEQGVELTMATYLIGLALGQLFYGPISDRFGRKPPIYAGFTLYIIGSFGCMLANDMGMLMAMRVLQALGACGGVVIGRAIVRDRCEPHEAARAFSTLMLIVALAPVLAPILGGWVVTAISWRAIFAFQGLMGVAVVIAMHYVLTESRDPAHVVPLRVRNVARAYAALLRDPAFIGYTMIGGFGMGAMFCYVTGFPTVMTEIYRMPPQDFGWLIGLNGLAFMAASRMNIVALRTIGPAEVLRRFIALPLLFALLLAAWGYWAEPPLWGIVALQLCFFVTVGRVSPNVAALALAPHGRDAGAASALMGSLQSIIAMLSGAALGAFEHVTITLLATLMGVGAACSWLAHGWVTSRQSGRLQT
jgi:DHA1 family bicyclomycin/chloramphenicol resistance-like MFS transporter